MQTDQELKKKAERLNISLVGIDTKDNLESVRQDGGYIINLMDDYHSSGVDNSGSHWTGIYKEGKQVAYFDSFGMPPPANIQLVLFRYKPYAYNNTQIQNEVSGWCGNYTLYFLWFMQNNKKIKNLSDRLEKFVGLWNEDVEQNLTLLNKYLGSL